MKVINMARRLSDMTWQDVQIEMSIAGDADKVVKVGEEILTIIAQKIDLKNLPEIDNMEFALRKIIAEIKTIRRKEYERQHKAILNKLSH